MSNEVYSAGCIQADVCGVAYDQDGLYFPCPTGASIYKSLVAAKLISKFKFTTLNEVKANRHKFFSQVCKYCGMFKKGGYHNIDTSAFARTTEEPKSKTWQEIEIL